MTLLILFTVFTLNLLLYTFNIIILNEYITHGILFILSLYGLWIYYKTIKGIKDVIFSLIFIIFIGLILGIIINNLFFIGIGYSIIISSILLTIGYLKIFQKELCKNYDNMFTVILSFQLIIIFISSLFIITPIGNNFIPYKGDKLYDECISDDCFEIFYMNDPFFFGEDYIQIFKTNKKYQFIKFSKNKIGIRLPDDIGNKFNITYSSDGYILDYVIKTLEKKLIIK